MMETIKKLLAGSNEDIHIGLHLLKGTSLEELRKHFIVHDTQGLKVSIANLNLEAGDGYFAYDGYVAFIHDYQGICFNTYYHEGNVSGWTKFN